MNNLLTMFIVHEKVRTGLECLQVCFQSIAPRPNPNLYQPSTDHTVDYEVKLARNFERYETRFAPHKALKSIKKKKSVQ
jgi:hypothetical protein